MHNQKNKQVKNVLARLEQNLRCMLMTTKRHASHGGKSNGSQTGKNSVRLIVLIT